MYEVDQMILITVTSEVKVFLRRFLNTRLHSNTQNLLAERYYVTFGLWHEPSVCCPSVFRPAITFVRPAQMVELFGNILHHLIAKGLG